MTIWVTLDWDAIATASAGILAVGSALFVARKQQRIKEQELRLSLLQERRQLVGRFRKFQASMMRLRNLDDEAVSDFWLLVQEVQLYFDPATARSVEDVFDEVWNYIGTAVSIRIYRDDEMHEEARAEVDKRFELLKSLNRKFPVAIKLMVEKTRVPEHI
ncbi:MAG TPA: hypothetical protein VN034_11815 [Sphingopyxis sp.]|nr:hypothetical protein [Sphingopyxis sp.]